MANHARLGHWTLLERDSVLRGVANVEDCQGLRDTQVDCVIRQEATGADATPEPKGDGMGIHFWNMPLRFEESLRLESQRLMVGLRVMHHSPDISLRLSGLSGIDI